MEKCSKSLWCRQLGARVIKDKFPWLKDAGVRVGFAESDSPKTKSGDRLVYAECHRVTPLYKAFIPYDFIIVFYTPNALGLTDRQKGILMEHELMHIGLDGKGDTKIVPHDVEDFRAIIDRYGLDWGDVNADS